MSRRSLGIILAASAAVPLLAVAWHKQIRDHFIPRNFGVVEPGQIYRAGWLTPAATRKVVRDHNIRTIVDLGAYEPGSREETLAQRTAEALGVERLVFRLEGDGTGNPNAYVAALNVLNDPQRLPVLVHCSAGAQRTSACIILYRHILQDQNILTQAYAESFDYKHSPGDNWHLMAYLAQYGDEIEDAFESGASVPGFDEVPVPGPARAPVGTRTVADRTPAADPADAATPADTPAPPGGEGPGGL